MSVKNNNKQHKCNDRDSDEKDENLMLKYCNGDSSSFQLLYLRYKSPLLRYLMLQLGSKSIAEEIHHEVWISIIDIRHHYETTALFKTMLYKITHNKVIDYYRKKKIVTYESQLDAGDDATYERIDEQSNLESKIILQEQVTSFIEAIHNLPIAQREVFILKQESGLTVKEISHILAIDVEAAQSRLRYAKSKLMQAMQEECNV